MMERDEIRSPGRNYGPDPAIMIRAVDRISGAFAVTRGPGHLLVYTNAAFRVLAGQSDLALGAPIATALAVPAAAVDEFTALLDRVFRTGRVERDCPIGAAQDAGALWTCTVWPQSGASDAAGCLVIELRAATADRVIGMWRTLIERMLVTAIRESDAADSAMDTGRRAQVESAAKSALLGSMSHELRTSLQAIEGYVALLEMEVHGPVTDAQRADLGRIRLNQEHLVGLLTSTLNYVKIESGGPVPLAQVVARQVIASSVELIEPLLDRKKVAFTNEACDSAIVVHGNVEHIVQILLNLLTNAIKFTPAGGTIVIRCESSESGVQFHVTDSGIGIQADKLETIFDPFVQLKPGLAGRDSGAGLGLAISRRLARAMGGDLLVASTPGAGSRFTLTLPRAGR